MHRFYYGYMRSCKWLSTDVDELLHIYVYMRMCVCVRAI